MAERRKSRWGVHDCMCCIVGLLSVKLHIATPRRSNRRSQHRSQRRTAQTVWHVASYPVAEGLASDHAATADSGVWYM